MSDPGAEGRVLTAGGWELLPPEVIKADPATCPHAVLDEGAGIAWGYEDCVTCGKRFPMRTGDF